ncbi:unnamed protein product [Effrenium voratum]|uniref:Uncharacterized protein n=1 Tax=Effrenium voratum TaxID=2562239 RepID=A0AA36IZ83_9DINO|nr:unnamed protein product [Effrenium voratum]CAJ1441873.1 unnamed protein product [Effrenium voratum]
MELMIGIEGANCAHWGTAIPGWVADFVVVAACCCSLLVTLSWLQLRKRFRFAFTMLMCSTGLAYGFGGLARVLLFLSKKSHEECGSGWEDPHSEWMFAWLAGMAIEPWSPAALLVLAAQLTRYGKPWVVANITGIIAGTVSCIEMVILASVRLEQSGVAASWWAVCATLFTVLMLLVDGIRSGFTRAITLCILSAFSFSVGALVGAGRFLNDWDPFKIIFHLCLVLMIVLAFQACKAANKEPRRIEVGRTASVIDAIVERKAKMERNFHCPW